MITIVDTGGANIASITNGFMRLGTECQLTSDSGKIKRAERLILPGVGAAGASMAKLKKSGLVDTIKSLTQPVLAICLGMQLLYERSEEDDTECLGLIPGKVKKFEKSDLVVPHMGWNRVDSSGEMLEAGQFYFVHSYYAPISDETEAVSDYGIKFSSAVRKENFYGVQFHPEKSGRDGEKVLEKFLRLS